MFVGPLSPLLSTIIYSAIAYGNVHFGNLQMEAIVKSFVVIGCLKEIMRLLAGKRNYMRVLLTITSWLIMLIFTFCNQLNYTERLHLVTCYNLSVVLCVWLREPRQSPICRLVYVLFFVLLTSILYILPTHTLRRFHLECSTETLTIAFSYFSLVLSIEFMQFVDYQTGNVRILIDMIYHLIFCIFVVGSSFTSTDKLALIMSSQILHDLISWT